MKRETAPPCSVDLDMGPPLGWVLIDLAASGVTGVLRTLRARGQALIHFLNGEVTRVQADDFEPLAEFLIRKELLTTHEMRSALGEVEHLDITLGQAFEKLGLMNQSSLDRLRARRTRDALEEIVATGGKVMEFESRDSDLGPAISVVSSVIRGVIRSGMAEDWLEFNRDAEGSLTVTENLSPLSTHVLKAVGEENLPQPNEPITQAFKRVGKHGENALAALIIVGLVELQETIEETPEGLEERASQLEATEEACRLLIRASELYEDRNDSAEARRAALSALRRRPRGAAPLAQVERLCIKSKEIATLELVYELVNGAMPGPYGRRALLYRAGRVFENEFGDISRAREYYQRAMSQVAESGAALDALKRTCLAMGEKASLSDVFVAVAMANHRPVLRKSWLRKALELAHTTEDMRRCEAIEARLRELEIAEDDADENESHDGSSVAQVADAANTSGNALGEQGDQEDDFDWSTLDDAFDIGTPPPNSSISTPRESAIKQPSSIAEALSEEAATTKNGRKRDNRGAQDFPFEGKTLSKPDDENDALSNSLQADKAQEWNLSRETDSQYEISIAQPASTSTSPSDIPSDLDELCGALAVTPGDLSRLRALRLAVENAFDEPASQAAVSLLALFDVDLPSCPLGRSESMQPITDEILQELITPPNRPEINALTALWRAASQMFTKELADLGVGRAIPQNSGKQSPAAKAFAEATRLLPGDPVRLLHMAVGPVAKVVLSRPLSLLAGPGALDDTPDVRFRVTKYVAMCHKPLILPALMSSQELTITLQAIHAAFGQSPPRGALHFQAASLAQDLWTTVPRDAQEEIRALLSDAPMPDVDLLQQEALATAQRMALLVTGDAAAAIRTAVADDPFLAGTDPTTDEGYQRAVERSEQVADLIRLALWPRYWKLRLGS